MKSLLCCLIILICQMHCIGQTSKTFEIKEVFVKDTTLRKTIKDFKRQSLNFYEDEKYIVRKTCSGEWGGSVWFKNKKNGIEYSCIATCPVVINKINGKYIVTATLDHMRGYSQIIEIKNPERLAIFKSPKPRAIIGKQIIRAVGDNESNSTKGTKAILDTIGISAIATFPFNGELFHVISDYKKTYIAKIAGGNFVTVDTLSDKSIWTSDPEVIKTADGHSIVLFINQKIEGYLDIFDNKITLFRYR